MDVVSCLRDASREYRELNSAQVTELHTTPTPLEFSRHVHANRPFVVRQCCTEESYPAMHLWTPEYLEHALGDTLLSIARSPNGQADSVVDGHFVEAQTQAMTMRDFFAKLRSNDSDAFYLQSQNSNLASELLCLLPDVQASPSFASQTFETVPDAVNIWIGDGKSATSLHKDPYENLYFVMQGSKTFTLYPPIDYHLMDERKYPAATWRLEGDRWSMDPAQPSYEVPWISQLPEEPEFPPMHVTLQRGDMLYLPGLWFHKVEQEIGIGPGGPADQQLAIAINYWYDLDYTAPLWTMQHLIRSLTALSKKEMH